MTVKCPKCRTPVRFPTQQEIGAQMRAIRTKKGLSLRATSRIVGLDISVLSRREAGKLRWTEEMMERYRRL